MGTLYARVERLHDVCGRLDYISSPERQENLVDFSNTMSDVMWKELAQQNQKAHLNNQRGATKNSNKCIEAREVIFHIPHHMEGSISAEQICQWFKDKYGVECACALHWNHERTNFHCHLIFSEREIDTEREVATRNMYYDSNWKRCKKADAVHTVKKGDYKSPVFKSQKKTEFKSKNWLEKDLKPSLSDLIGLELFENKKEVKLSQFKIGKNNPKSEEIKLHNELVREWNKKVDEVYSNSDLKSVKTDLIRERRQYLISPKSERKTYLKQAFETVSTKIKQILEIPEIWKFIMDIHFKNSVARDEVKQYQALNMTSKANLDRLPLFGQRELKKKYRAEIEQQTERLSAAEKELEATQSILDQKLENPFIKSLYGYETKIQSKWKRMTSNPHKLRNLETVQTEHDLYKLGVKTPDGITNCARRDVMNNPILRNRRIAEYTIHPEIFIKCVINLDKMGEFDKYDRENRAFDTLHAKLDKLMASEYAQELPDELKNRFETIKTKTKPLSSIEKLQLRRQNERKRNLEKEATRPPLTKKSRGMER